MFVASSLGEEIEDRTTTYLWSRPIGRWTIVVGKLLALAPIAMLLVVGGGYLAIQIETGAAPSAAWIGGTAGGALAISVMAAGLSVLVPKYGMALSIVYLVVIRFLCRLVFELLKSLRNLWRNVFAFASKHLDKLIASRIHLLWRADGFGFRCLVVRPESKDLFDDPLTFLVGNLDLAQCP